MMTQEEIDNMKQSEWCIGIGKCTSNCKCYEQQLLDENNAENSDSTINDISDETLKAVDVVVEALKETLTNEIEPHIYPQIGADVVLRLLESGIMKFA